MQGLFIAVLGPDGSGKSSLVSALARHYSKCSGIQCEVFHRMPRADSRPLVTNPHGAEPRTKIMGFLKLGYLAYVYNTGYRRLVQPALDRGAHVIFDRYYDDMLIDPRRYRFSGPHGLARLLARSIPRPDVWIALQAPASVLQKRKAEVTAEECERQSREYVEFVRRAGGFTISAAQPFHRVLEQAVQAIDSKAQQQLDAPRTARVVSMASR